MLMAGAGPFIKKRGEVCTVVRAPPVPSWLIRKRSHKSASDPAAREAAWEGLMLSASALASGEIVQVGNDQLLMQTVHSDPGSGELQWFAVATNAILVHQRYTKTPDGRGNVVEGWATLPGAVPAYGQIVTAEMRQADVGLVDGARYLFQVCKTADIRRLDRLIHNGRNHQVESIDDVGLPGVDRLQLIEDQRP